MHIEAKIYTLMSTKAQTIIDCDTHAPLMCSHKAETNRKLARKTETKWDVYLGKSPLQEDKRENSIVVIHKYY